MSTKITAENGAGIAVGQLGITVAHPEGIATIWARLSQEQRRALADALDPGRDFSGVDWKAMYVSAAGERDAAVARADQLRDERDDAVQSCITVGRARDEWRARAEAAEARTAPAVSRADVAEALSRCLNPEMWNVTFPSVVNEVCDLFGVEAGQATDPLLDKAQEFAALADWELTDREAELLHTVARHVLGQEAGQ